MGAAFVLLVGLNESLRFQLQIQKTLSQIPGGLLCQLVYAGEMLASFEQEGSIYSKLAHIREYVATTAVKNMQARLLLRGVMHQSNT